MKLIEHISDADKQFLADYYGVTEFSYTLFINVFSRIYNLRKHFHDKMFLSDRSPDDSSNVCILYALERRMASFYPDVDYR
jgi:hypothetical protein